MSRNHLRGVRSGRLASAILVSGAAFATLGALVLPLQRAQAQAPLCYQQTYSVSWFGTDTSQCVSAVLPNVHTCALTEEFYCGNGTKVTNPHCKFLTDGAHCWVNPTCDYGTGCSWTGSTAAECTHQGDGSEQCGADGHGNGVDDDFDGCIDQGCIAGEGACTCVMQCAKPLSCTTPQWATCTPFNGQTEICFDHVDNNCNGQVDEGCAPKPACQEKVGKDPILLGAHAAVTEPFADFEAQFVGKLSFTRTYNSNDASIVTGAPPDVFGRGWHHDWESGLQCDAAGVCTVWRGQTPAMRFRRSGTALSLDGSETWDIYAPYSNDVISADQHQVLVRRPSGTWQLYLTDGSALVFDRVCDSCGGQSSCPDADAGIWRLVQSIDPQGNPTFVRYDGSHGLLIGLYDELGHSLELRGDGTCPYRARELQLDGELVASYSWAGQDLSKVTDADGLVMRAYYYEGGNAGMLRAVKNGAEEIIAEFSYDGYGRAIGIIDDASSAAVNYDAAGGIAVTETFRGRDGDTSSTSIRTLNQDGRVTSTSDGCACGPARTQEWSNHQLTCSMDALGHVTHHDYDALGRVTRTVQFPGTTCTVPSTLPAGSTDERRSYGVTRQIAQGVSLDLETASNVNHWSNTSVAGWYRDSYDYSQAPNASIDPAGYTCAASPLPEGSVVCRQITSGYVFVDASKALQNERHATFFSYDAHGRLIRVYGPINLDFPSTGDVPPVEERTFWPDDASLARRGRLHEVKRYPSPGGTPLVTSYDYDAYGVYQTTDPRGGVTTVVKDGRGRPTFVIAADSRVTETRYHDGTAPRLQLLPGGGVIRYGYDAWGRVASVEHLDGDPDVGPVAVSWSEVYAFDSAGNRFHAERRDRNGRVTWQQDRGFDAQHRVVWESNPDQPSAGRTWTYDASGFLTGTTDEVGRATAFVPDSQGRVQKVRRTGPPSDALDVASYTYQAATELVAQVNAANAPGADPGTAAYKYDDFGRLYQLKSGTVAVGTQSYWYDARGNLLRRLSDDGSNKNTVMYAYDGLDRLVSMTAGAITYRYSYDTAPYQGLLASVQEPDRVASYEYDTAGRVVAETIQENGVTSPLVTSYAYGADGLVHQVTYPSGLRVQYDRDAATGEVVRVSNADSGTRYADSATRAPGGPLTGLVFGNGARLDASFNRRYEPVSIANGPLSLGYAMSAAGDVLEISDRSLTLSGCSRNTSRAFTYDFLDRLTGSPSWLQYAYDGAGNRSNQTTDGEQAAYSYTSTNGSTLPDQAQSRRITGSEKLTFLYDTTGNATALARYLDNVGQVTVMCLRHDELGRLVSAGTGLQGIAWSPSGCLSDSDVTQFLARFKYDNRNQRIARQNATTGQWTYLVSDSAGHPLSELALVSGNWTKMRDYVWMDGQPLAQIEYPGPTTAEGYVYYLHTDHIGLPRAMTNASGQLVWNSYAKPYGDIVEKTTTDPLSGRVIVTNLRLPGQYDERLLGSLGLQGPYYNWNRWYLPGVGRYLEPDPIALAGGFNTPFGVDWYGYALQNPLRFTDRTGWAPRDRRFGLPDEFWDWYHGQKGGKKIPNIDKDEADELYREWKRLGEPRRDNKWDRAPPEDVPWWELFDPDEFEMMPFIFLNVCGKDMEYCLPDYLKYRNPKNECST